MAKKTWIKMVKVILYNAKWIMAGLLFLNLFGFGYWEKACEGFLDGEETLWGSVMVIATILFTVFNKKWKSLCKRMFDKLDR